VFLICFITTVKTNGQINIRINDPSAYEIRKHHKYPGKEIFKEIKKIILEEKISLKKDIQGIEEKLKKGLITKQKSEELKSLSAKKYAENMERRITLEELKFKKVTKEFTDTQLALISVDSVDHIYESINRWGKRRTVKRKVTRDMYKKIKSATEKLNKQNFFNQGVLAYGLNNVMVDNKLSSDYNGYSSHFFEAGYTFKHRLFKNNWNYFLKYGGSLLFNNLKLKNNQIHTKKGELAIFSQDLEVSKLKNVQFIIPLHFEIDFSKPTIINGYKRYNREKFFRMGLGGYAGYRLFTRQTLKYKSDDLSIKEKSTGNHNLNNCAYGLSGYLGYRSISLYVKKDLNNLFKNSNAKGVSVGLRLEI
jgi:hypothetical protein